jgi:uncharacterized membrane protein YgcG
MSAIAGCQMKAKITQMRLVVRFATRIAIAMLMLAGTQCSSNSSSSLNPFASAKTPQQQALEMEPMLQAAGFSALPATTPEQDAKLKTLPPLKLSYYSDQNGVKHYWVADPDVCKCLFHGDEASYQRYENIKLENQIAERDRAAVESQQQQRMMGPSFAQPGMGFGSGFGGGGFGGGGIGFGGGGFGMSF